MAVKERQAAWDVQLPHVEFTYFWRPIKCVRDDIPAFSLRFFDHANVRRHQSLDRDQRVYCNLSRDRQQKALISGGKTARPHGYADWVARRDSPGRHDETAKLCDGRLSVGLHHCDHYETRSVEDHGRQRAQGKTLA